MTIENEIRAASDKFYSALNRTLNGMRVRWETSGPKARANRPCFHPSSRKGNEDLFPCLAR